MRRGGPPKGHYLELVRGAIKLQTEKESVNGNDRYVLKSIQ